MVHKKSEYMLQFHILAKDLRKQIWQDNIKFRESQRSVNQAHHYWDYQIVDDCSECENCEEEDEDDGAFLPPHKLKHNILLAKYGKRKDTDDEVDALPTSQSSVVKSKNLAQRQVQMKLPELELTSARSVAVQTPDFEIHEQHRATDASRNESRDLKQNISEPSTSDFTTQSKKALHHQEERLYPSFPVHPLDRPATPSEPQKYRPCTASAVREHPHSIVRTSASHDSESPRRRSPSRFSALSRTSRQSYFEEKKTPFASYGWNDTEKDMGAKKTYNVTAPKREVYPQALHASKQRKEDIKQYLVQETKQDLSSARSEINHSSMWMSEYRDKYTGGYSSPLYTERKVRPASASILKTPVDWCGKCKNS